MAVHLGMFCHLVEFKLFCSVLKAKRAGQRSAMADLLHQMTVEVSRVKDLQGSSPADGSRG